MAPVGGSNTSAELVCVGVFLKVDQLREAIEELFYFEFVLDDIPIWGFVGYLEESGFLPHSHKVPLLCSHLSCSDGTKKRFYLTSRFLFLRSAAIAVSCRSRLRE